MVGALPKLGLKPDEEDAAFAVPGALNAEDDGVKPEGTESTGLFSTVFGAKRLDPAEAVAEAFVPLIALANMFDVDVAVGSKLGAGVTDWGVGVAGASLPRARLVDVAL